MNKLFLSCLFCVCVLASNAQDQASPAMADHLRDEGKIYVVIAVIAIVFLALAGFMVYLERRLSKLEQTVKKDQP